MLLAMAESTVEKLVRSHLAASRPGMLAWSAIERLWRSSDYSCKR